MNTNRGFFLSGFTLVEIIISSSIFFIVVLAVHSIFTSGLSIWKKGSEVKFFERSIAPGLEKFSRDLRHTFKFSNTQFDGIRFTGTKETAIFAGLIEDDNIGRISYFVNEEGAFCRKQETFSETFETGEEAEYKRLIPDVTDLNFSYCYTDDAGYFKWKNDWADDNSDDIPLAVRIELTVAKRQEEKFEKTIFMPLGTAG
jgi:hypothetical protein